MMRSYNNDSLKWDKIQPGASSLIGLLGAFIWCVISRLQGGSYTQEELLTTMDFNDTPFAAIGEAIIDALVVMDVLGRSDDHFSINPRLRYYNDRYA
jgi:hypothetical protein